MMRFHYISPSVLPSRSANAVHVVLQCDALARMGVEVTLYAKRKIQDESLLVSGLADNYGVDASSWRLVTYHSHYTRADTLRIATLAFRDIVCGRCRDVILSRNLYAAYILAVLFRRPLIYETHQLELGIKRKMQRAVITCPWVKIVTISQKLVECLHEHHGVLLNRPLVLHDAAPAGIIPLDVKKRRVELGAILNQDLSSWECVCGYFGHLYAGRGIEIIEDMAGQRPACLFLVYGGNDTDITRLRRSNSLHNLWFMGHVSHLVAQKTMRSVDVLLMPYQINVSIGVAKHDTARWMSPMKMFEYLATGVPVISSDLPVLREVLINELNCFLVPPDNVEAWVKTLDRVISNPELAQLIGKYAHTEYLTTHSWDHRAVALLKVTDGL